MARRAFSRLTGPGASRPAVLDRLSAEMSKSKRSVPRSKRGDGHAGAVDRDAVAEPDIVQVAGRGLRPAAGDLSGPTARLRRASAGATRVMRPMPLMIPVNIGRLSPLGRTLDRSCTSGASVQAAGRASSRRSSPIGVIDGEAQPRRVGESGQRAELGQAATGADQHRCEVDQVFVDQPLAQQRAVEPVTGLDVQFVDAAPRQVGQHGRQIDLAALARQQRDLGAASLQRLEACRIGLRGIDQHRPGASRMRAAGGMSRRESTITRSGWRGVSTSRTSSRGSSSSTVPAPVSSAPARRRQR